MMKSEKRQEDLWMESDSVYIYGAGKFARYLYYFVTAKNIKINKFIVTDKSENPNIYQGIKVCSLEEALEEKDIFETPILIALKDGADEVELKLNESGVKNVYAPYSIHQDEILRSERPFRQKEFNENSRDYSLKLEYPFGEIGHVYLTKKGEEKALCRWAYTISEIGNLISKFDFRKFEDMFGKFERIDWVYQNKRLETSKYENAKKMEIYVASSHLDDFDISEFDDQGVLIPIQVGAALTVERKGFLTDDTGDNISVKNRNYCECTALYWIWKNTSGQDYVGLCHYRRRFASVQMIKEVIATEDIDVISVNPVFKVETIRDFYVSHYIEERDWECMRKFAIKYDSEYEKVLKDYENSHFYLANNMMIYKRNIFEQYCEFAFHVALEIEEYYGKIGVTKNNRYIGYIFENLSSIFLMRHRDELNVKYVDMEFLSIGKTV